MPTVSVSKGQTATLRPALASADSFRIVDFEDGTVEVTTYDSARGRRGRDRGRQ
jgi:hypothetical protein